MWPNHPVGSARFLIPDESDLLYTDPARLVRPVKVTGHHGDGCVCEREGWSGRFVVPVRRLFLHEIDAREAVVWQLQQLERGTKRQASIARRHILALTLGETPQNRRSNGLFLG